MLLVRIAVLLLLASLALAQKGSVLVDRIRGAPLTPQQRDIVIAAFQQKNFDRLEATLTGAILGTSPERASTLYSLLGALEFVGGRMPPSVQAFRQADALKSVTDQDRFTLAMALVDLGGVKESRIELTRLNQAHPNQPIYLYWLARLDYGQRLYDDAVEKLKNVIRMDPDSVRGYDNLGLSYDMMGLTDEAQTALLKAVEINRKQPNPSAWPPHNLGYLQLRLLQFPAAEENLREALKYDPAFALAHYHLARVLENEKHDEGAIEEYQSAAALDPKLAEPLYSLALLYRRTGREAEAVRALDEYRKRKAVSDSK